MKRITAFLALVVAVGLTALALAQAPEPVPEPLPPPSAVQVPVPGEAAPMGEDNGFFVNLLENQLSAPGRQIRVTGISGALSSRARIERLTVADDQGVWLELQNVQINWRRLALVRRRLDVQLLAAERVSMFRRPIAPESAPPLPQVEAQPFQLPQLPLAVLLNELRFPQISFAAPVFGQDATLSLAGALTLDRAGTLESDLDVNRIDSVGGTLALNASFSNATRQLGVDIHLQEPENGIVANLLRIEGRPPIELTLQGSGPLDEVDVNFTFDAAGNRIADGLVALRGGDQGLGFSADFSGGLAPLIPSTFRDFFEGQTVVRVAGINKSAGGLRLDTVEVSGAVLNLSGRLETGADNFLRALTLTGTLGDAAAPPVTLPVPGGATTLNSAVLYLDYGAASRWNGFLVLDRLATPTLSMEDVTLNMGGLAQNLDDSARRNVTVSVEGLATGVWSPDPDVAGALGTRLDLFADAALPPNGPVQIRQFQVSGTGLQIFSAGEIANLVYTGRNVVRIPDLAVLSGLAGRDLAGSIDLHADGSVTPLSGAFDLAFDGSGNDLRLGEPRLDPLLAGETTLSGRAVRDEAGIRTDNLRVANPQLSFASNGTISSTQADIGFDATLADLGLLDPRMSGAVTATGRATGQGAPIAVTLDARVPSGAVMGRRVSNFNIGFDGAFDGPDVTGTLAGNGLVDALVIAVGADLAAQGGSLRADNIDVAVGANRLTGSVARDGSAPITGTLSLRAPDIAPLAAFALTEASGAVDADVSLQGEGSRQDATVTANVTDLVIADNRIGALDIDATVTDLFDVPLGRGTVNGENLMIAGLDIRSVALQANQSEANRMQVNANARLGVGTLIDAGGAVELRPQGAAITLETLELRQDPTVARLVAPATIVLDNGQVDLTPLQLDFGTGSLTARGSVGDSFDVALDITSLPLSIANTIQPQLGLAGQVDGTARITGPRQTPDARFDLNATGLRSTATEAAGLPPLTISANGRTDGQVMSVNGQLSGNGGLAASVAGSVPLGAGALDVGINLQSFPLALVDRAAGNLGLNGTVAGTARVTGTLANPSAGFDLRGTGLSAAITRDNAMPPFAVAASGAYQGNVVTLSSLSVTAPGGLNLTGTGRVPLSGPGLDASLAGGVPIALINPMLEAQLMQAEGVLQVNATVRGSVAAPVFGGSMSLNGGTFIAPGANLRLENINIDAGLEGTDAVLRSFSARPVGGGVITASGRVALLPRSGFPADVTVQMSNVRYTDGAFVSTGFSGDIALRGPLVGGGGMLSGRINLDTTEISIAEGLGPNAGAALEQVIHVRPPPRVAATLARARVEQSQRVQRETPGIGLDLRISAPNQIFVRGRGLDVELGGEVHLEGTTTDVRPVGQFDLRRGRLSILGQRIEFQEGSLTLVGNLDPEINFVASTQSADVTAYITVSGSALQPEITFSSQPELPQDEVLAHILFNRSTANLSPFQLAQLAAAAAELAGGGGGGILSQLRSATGLDDLDIITATDGSTALRAGKYVSDRVYVDVQAGSNGENRLEIVLDVNDRVTARGSVGNDGNTILGIFYERDF